jgi:hypothetical protein
VKGGDTRQAKLVKILAKLKWKRAVSAGMRKKQSAGNGASTNRREN